MFNRLIFPAFAIPALLISAAAVSTLSPVFAQQQNATPAALAGFSVKVTYSQKATDTLAAKKETVVVAGYLYGFPKPGTPRQYIDKMGQVGIGDDIHHEIAPDAIATFGAVKLDQAMLKWLDARGPQILINVYSGRKSSPNNLLDCGIYEGSLAAIQGTTIPIACKLIGE
ncbi:MAG TPA: hypothetical protein VGG45_01070 [Terracidiphilus sp.]|jgi:hypothetical protein